MYWILGLIILVIIYSAATSQMKKDSDKLAEEKFNEIVQKENISLSKEILIKTYLNDSESKELTCTKMIVDDKKKRFGVLIFNGYTKEIETRLYNYSDLLQFNVYEDGEQLLPGRALTTIAGGLTFGLGGAIAGSVLGDKKVKNKCTELSIKMELDNLETPLLTLTILQNCFKGSGLNGVWYRSAKKEADEICAVLTYILKHK